MGQRPLHTLVGWGTEGGCALALVNMQGDRAWDIAMEGLDTNSKEELVLPLCEL